MTDSTTGKNVQESRRPSTMTPKKLLTQVRRMGLRTGDESAVMVREDRDAR